MKTKITGKITGAINNGMQIEGYIQGDTRGRFRDGTRIITPDITKIKNIKGKMIVETLNSVYEVELIGAKPRKSVSKQN